MWGIRYIDDLVLRDRDTTGNGTLDERLYFLPDANWNVTAVVDDSGAVQERIEYTPYGWPQFLSPTFGARTVSSFDVRYTYTTREWESEVGLYYFRNRWYDSQLGLFVGRDLIEYVAGLNLYGYVHASPVILLDPFGLVVPLIPIVIGASCAACWGVAGVFFNAAHQICEKSEDVTSYLTCFISAMDDMEGALDWYSWSVINGACLACGGGLAGAAKKFGQKMGAKWAKKKAAKEAVEEAAEKAAKEKAEKCALCLTLKKAKKEACDKAKGMSCTNSRGNCLPLSDEVFMLRGTLLSACASARSAHQKVCFDKDDPLAPGHWKQITDQARAATKCFTCAYRN